MEPFHDDHAPRLGKDVLVEGAGALRGSAEHRAAASCVFMPEHCEYLGEINQRRRVGGI